MISPIILHGDWLSKLKDLGSWQRQWLTRFPICERWEKGLQEPAEGQECAGDGFIVVGSQDGQLRLYGEKSMSRANTAIPGLGSPITSVDVTYDGKWVLATTKNYLMVVKTAYTVSFWTETSVLITVSSQSERLLSQCSPCLQY